jgi:hypothetical protein
VDLRFWYGLFGPRDPRADQRKARARGLDRDGLARRARAPRKLDITPGYAPGTVMRTREREIANWTKFIDAHGIKPE